MTLEFLLRHHERTGSAQALHLATATAARMARGGMYDQLAGGFARYSVDARWVVPHFEKMLYDNALLLRAYAHLARVPGPHAALARRVAEETAAFLLRDLRTPEGGFASALDADTDGVEGLTYAWTPAQLRRGAGGRRTARGRRELLEVSPRRDLRARVVDAAAARGPRRPRALGARPGRAAGRARPAPAARPRRQGRHRLERHGGARARRGGRRPGPAGLGRGRRRDRGPAARAARRRRPAAPLVARRHRRGRGRGAGGPRLPRRGAARAAPGHGRRATGSSRPSSCSTSPWPTSPTPRLPAPSSTPRTTPRPCCTGPGSSPTTPRRAGRPRWPGALLTASVLVDDPQRYRDAAEAALRSAGTLAQRFPRFAGHWLTVAEAAVRGPLQVAVVGPEPDRDVLAAHARTIAPGGTVVVAGRAGRRGRPAAGPPAPGRRRGRGLRLPRLRLRPPGHHAEPNSPPPSSCRRLTPVPARPRSRRRGASVSASREPAVRLAGSARGERRRGGGTPCSDVIS